MPRMKLCSCGKAIPDTAVCDVCRKQAQKRSNQNKDPQMKKLLNSKRWKDVRTRVIKRDKGICIRCMFTRNYVEKNNLQVHHIKPRNKYPELMFEESNLITLCQSCNTHIGTKEQLDFDWEIQTESLYEPVL